MSRKIKRYRHYAPPTLIPITDISTVSKYWSYANFTSRRARNNKSFYYGGCFAHPIYFETAINSIQFRAYLRKLFGIKESEHIEVYTSKMTWRNKVAKRVAKMWDKKEELKAGKAIVAKQERINQLRTKMQEGFLKFMAKFAQKHKVDNSCCK